MISLKLIASIKQCIPRRPMLMSYCQWSLEGSILHTFKIIDTEFDILRSIVIQLREQTFPLTIRDSGSAFINQYFIPRGSSSVLFSSTPFGVASSTGSDSRFARFRGVTFFSGVSFWVKQHIRGCVPEHPHWMPHSSVSSEPMAFVNHVPNFPPARKVPVTTATTNFRSSGSFSSSKILTMTTRTLQLRGLLSLSRFLHPHTASGILLRRCPAHQTRLFSFESLTTPFNRKELRAAASGIPDLSSQYHLVYVGTLARRIATYKIGAFLLSACGLAVAPIVVATAQVPLMALPGILPLHIIDS